MCAKGSESTGSWLPSLFFLSMPTVSRLTTLSYSKHDILYLGDTGLPAGAQIFGRRRLVIQVMRCDSCNMVTNDRSRMLFPTDFQVVSQLLKHCRPCHLKDLSGGM